MLKEIRDEFHAGLFTGDTAIAPVEHHRAMTQADEAEDTDEAAGADAFTTAAAQGARREPPASVQAARRAWHLELIKLVRMGAFREIERRHGRAVEKWYDLERLCDVVTLKWDKLS